MEMIIAWGLSFTLMVFIPLRKNSPNKRFGGHDHPKHKQINWIIGEEESTSDSLEQKNGSGTIYTFELDSDWLMEVTFPPILCNEMENIPETIFTKTLLA